MYSYRCTHGSHDGLHRDAGFYDLEFPSFAEFADDTTLSDLIPFTTKVQRIGRDALGGARIFRFRRPVLVYKTRMLVYMTLVD